MKFSLCGPWIPESLNITLDLHIHIHSDAVANQLKALQEKLDASTERLDDAVDEAANPNP